MIEFKNESGLDFKDISTEKFRKYLFANGKSLTIKKPMKLNVSQSGGHRVFDFYGTSYYINPSQGWFIKWRAYEGEAHFVK